MSQTSIAIIGGGIGGLSAALGLLKAGFDVHVYEQSPELLEVGAGFGITPNASKVLTRLGLADELSRIAVTPTSFHQRRWQDGRTLLRARRRETMEANYGAPAYTFHRGELNAVLVAAMPKERVHAGRRCTGFAERGGRIEASFSNGATAAADVLIGADGIHSAVRRQLLGEERPRFTGCIAYRGLIPMQRLAHLGIEIAHTSWIGPGRHFVHYPVAAGRLLNFVGLVEQDAWDVESWTEPGDLGVLAAAYDGWHPQVTGIIAATEQTFKWALLDRMPLPRWSQGRVTLLGDACHPMLPFLGQGAAQAIEDGATLTACLLRHEGDVTAALALYERIRLPRTARVQEISRNNKERFHLPDGPAQQARDAQLASGAAPDMGWLYGHDAAVLPEQAATAR